MRDGVHFLAASREAKHRRGSLDEQEARAAGPANGQAEHGAIAPELLNDAAGFGRPSISA